MTVIKLPYIVFILLFSTLTLYSQEYKLENNNESFYQLTNSNVINSDLLNNIDFGILIFKNGKCFQYIGKDSILTGNYTKINNDSLLFDFDEKNFKCFTNLFIKSGTYKYKLNSYDLFLINSLNQNYQFYRYNIKDVKKSKKYFKRQSKIINSPNYWKKYRGVH